MSETLKNAPLAELVAEVRWTPLLTPGVPGASIATMAGGPSFFSGDTKDIEEFFSRFAALIQEAEYTHSERLVPQGFPFLFHQPVCRYRPGNGELSSLYQVGPGIFVANAMPPYESWNAFGPVVRKGVQAMIEARGDNEKSTPFLSTNLRYIDAFGADLTEGRSPKKFVEEVLGFKIDIPDGLIRHVPDGREPSPFLQVQLPMAAGMTMNFGFGDGQMNGRQALMMDMSVATTIAISPDADAVMETFNRAHDAIHSSFVALTEPIAHLMAKE